MIDARTGRPPDDDTGPATDGTQPDDAQAEAAMQAAAMEAAAMEAAAMEALAEWASHTRAELVRAAWLAGCHNVAALHRAARVTRSTIYADLGDLVDDHRDVR